MGCAHSKEHPKNSDLVKFKKKFDTEPIKKLHLKYIWIIGANQDKTFELAKDLTSKTNFALITEKDLIENQSKTDTDRGKIIKEIMEDGGLVCPGIVLDLVIENLLNITTGEVKGIIFQGIPRDKEQAWHLQRLIGPVTLVIYCELKGDSLKTCLTKEDDNENMIKHKIEYFQKSINQLFKRKEMMKIDGELEISTIIDECVQKINALTS